jgi:hypothetical protein
MGKLVNTISYNEIDWVARTVIADCDCESGGFRYTIAYLQ